MLIGIDRDGQMNFNEVAKRIMEVRMPQGRVASCNAQCETPLDAEVPVAVAPVERTATVADWPRPRPQPVVSGSVPRGGDSDYYNYSGPVAHCDRSSTQSIRDRLGSGRRFGGRFGCRLLTLASRMLQHVATVRHTVQRQEFDTEQSGTLTHDDFMALAGLVEKEYELSDDPCALSQYANTRRSPQRARSRRCTLCK